MYERAGKKQTAKLANDERNKIKPDKRKGGSWAMETKRMPVNNKRNERLRTCAHKPHEHETLRKPKLSRNDLAKNMTTKPSL